MTLFHGLGPFASSLSSGDFDFITSASGTAVSSISINNCFSADYDHYLILRNLLNTGGAGDGVHVRLRVGGVDASAADYRYQYLYASSTTVGGSRATAQTQFTEGLGNTEATSMGFARMWISNPFGTVRTTAWADAGQGQTANIQMNSYVQEHDLTTSYDGLTVRTAVATLTGSIYVYGLAV